MKILVTGGAGFIGSHVVDRYVDLGHEVAVIDNLSTGFEKNLNAKAKFFKADIRELEKIYEIVGDFKPDVINHHAALAEVTKSIENPSDTLAVNVMGTANVLLAGGKASIKHFIFSSTGGAIYGDPVHLPADESCKPAPLSPYGLSKLLGENIIEFYARIYGLTYTIFRYSNVYGPRQNPGGEAGVVAIFTNLIKSGTRPTIFGDGSKTRDYVYVGDIVSANELALDTTENNLLNLGWGKEISDQEIFDAIASALNFSEDSIYAPFREGEVSKISLDSTKARKILGWVPKVNITEGINITTKCY
ncbi:MAG: hypothetical protein A3G58_00975 [Candidatus Colwellbacteria bacterium RIFCSPLOWO2_12_FULL_46_17]|uniref:NAD-dependent epimerase/dehydratase domain-containing protein n=1 Tax=Candidatus Colwellbacteria bacterium RIFCSPLOWO2_12_FULL_46_17 TaxID=1797695 RepID=A0A1G1ZEQ0_9BACT|nr:MAG: hypothetical protein A3G58_00975 [Candidatus Colwellbacteria bacterium RIFCSPLOWO2_12_FULL_46_17]